MHAWRSITVVLAIGLVAMAQQLCCCVLTPTVDSLLASEAPGHSSSCCHHDRAPADSPVNHDDHRTPPDRHDCGCGMVRTLAPVKVESFSPNSVLIEFTVLPLTLPPSDSGLRLDADGAFRPSGGWGRDWGGPRGGHGGPPGTPLAQRVQFTV